MRTPIMHNRDIFLAEVERLEWESMEVFNTLVLPGWTGPHHGMPECLYGFVMRVFSQFDLLSLLCFGNYGNQTIRLTDFFNKYLPYGHLEHQLAIINWRHKLMHTASPRALRGVKSGKRYLWLLQWCDVHLPRAQHFRFQDEQSILNISLQGLISDLRLAANKYFDDLESDQQLQDNHSKIFYELKSYKFQEKSNNKMILRSQPNPTSNPDPAATI